MSAIAGILWRDGRESDKNDVEKMLKSMWRRGPHGQNVWHSKSITLGNGLLQNTPESLNEVLPLTKRNLTITADARIDNRKDLISDISEATHTITDSELILLAFEKWGEDCLQKLIGDFAFAIWNERTKTLFCARDHFGIKPFHYFVSPNFFAFASDPRGLLAIRFITKKINEARIADIFFSWLEGADKTSTFYKDIYRLPPARKLKVTADFLTINSYWSLEPGREIRLASDSEYEEAFREVFTESVRCRLRTNKVAASMLSGGLDSSSIVCVARDLLREENNGERLKVFAGVLVDEKKCIERPFIDSVLEGGELDATLLRENELEQFTENLTQHIREADDLFFSPDLPYIMYSLAGKQGLNVLLDGMDGDCVTAPNSAYFSEYIRNGKWIDFAKEAFGHAAYFDTHLSQLFNVFWNHGAKTLAKMLLPESLLQEYRYRHSQKAVCLKLLNESVLKEDFAKRVGVEERLLSVMGDTSWEDRTFRENQCQTLRQPFLTSAIERYDRIAMMNSVEARHPFLDKRLVEFCVGLPLTQMAGRGVPKIILRRSLENMPEKVRWRGYANRNLNGVFHPQMVVNQGKLFDEAFSNDLKEIKCYVNRERVISDYKDLRNDNRLKAFDLFPIVVLVLWLRLNF